MPPARRRHTRQAPPLRRPPVRRAKRPQEAITCPKEEVLRRLQRETTCSSCCSALRVMIQRPIHQLTLLQSFVSHEDVEGYVLKENLATPKSLEEACAKFPLNEWLKNCQPLKRDKRCPMHANSRHIFNSADLWEDMWAEMSTQQKLSICSVNAEELHDKLWQHCTDKHHLCKDCRNNVMWAFDKLTRKCARARNATALGLLLQLQPSALCPPPSAPPLAPACRGASCAGSGPRTAVRRPHDAPSLRRRCAVAASPVAASPGAAPSLRLPSLPSSLPDRWPVLCACWQGHAVCGD